MINPLTRELFSIYFLFEHLSIYITRYELPSGVPLNTHGKDKASEKQTIPLSNNTGKQTNTIIIQMTVLPQYGCRKHDPHNNQVHC